MAKEYTREQLRQLYIKLPEEIKEVVSADETALEIEEICKRNGIVDERVGEISDLIRDVLFGVSPPDEFEENLKKEVNLEAKIAKKVAQEINRFIFYPVKPALEELYKIEVAPPAKPTGVTPPPEIKPLVGEKPEAKPEEARKDIYREPIE